MSRRFFALSDVTARIAQLLEPAFGRRFWLRAEISSGRERRHFFCDLVETGPRGEVTAQLRCTIWAADLARIRSRFKQAGLDLALENGTRIGIECELEYHPRHGLSLVGHDMDPTFALGELELRRRRILEALQRDGLIGRNALRPLPLLPNRIGVVTSRGSAAYGDFVKTLGDSRHGFRLLVADAVMQGRDTQRSVLAGLEACVRLGVDLVVVLRGGGSKTDLAWLDDEALARAIAACPLPVWTGIGHETDSSVLDAVAGCAHKTPTAVAEAIVACFDEVATQIEDAATRLRSIWRLRWEAQWRYLERARNGSRQGSRKLLDLRRSALLQAAERMRGRVLQRLAREAVGLGGAGAALRAGARAGVGERRSALAHSRRALERGVRTGLRLARIGLAGRIERLSLRRVLQRLTVVREALLRKQQLLRAADPRTVLERGFSLTTTSAGELVRSVAQLEVGERVRTAVSDGHFESAVQTLERREGDG